MGQQNRQSGILGRSNDKNSDQTVIAHYYIIMSYCKEDGKDRYMFVTEEDYNEPAKAIFDDDDLDDRPGLILENGDINWNCPCLGGMATGPCGPQFREAFSCFHFSEEDPKGSECYDQFKTMQDCMLQHGDLYDKYNKDDDDDEDVDNQTSPEPSDTQEQTVDKEQSESNDAKESSS